MKASKFNDLLAFSLLGIARSYRQLAPQLQRRSANYASLFCFGGRVPNHQVVETVKTYKIVMMICIII
jgi:hypothetical protein